MRLTKLGHACVRLDKDDRTLVVDPGALTPEQDAFEGADAVLITHEHFDHFEAGRLRRAVRDDPDLEVLTCGAVAAGLADLGGRVRTVGDGDSVTVAGFEIAVLGRKHEIVHPDLPPVENVGFLVDGQVFHPGDAFTVPPVAVPTLLTPTSAPWMKVTDMYAYLRELEPARAYSIHDGLLNDAGLKLVDSALAGEAERTGKDYRRLRPGEFIDV
ncbi:MBL fold metallo-hydrolase [Actinomadura scrupuli]|uniref:MBL fold metallo-hydrolase n=1 Tax=Actinomadura scrupuli TaxID=559629 RepID=UPI003D972DD6